LFLKSFFTHKVTPTMCRILMYLGGKRYDTEQCVCSRLPADVAPTWENVRFQLEDEAKMVDIGRLGGRSIKGCHSHYVAFTESEAQRPERERFVVGDRTNLQTLCEKERLLVVRKVCLGDPPFCYNRHVPDAMLSHVMARINAGRMATLHRELECTTNEASRLDLIIQMQGQSQPPLRWRNPPHPSREPGARATYAGYLDYEGRPQPWPAAPQAPNDHICAACHNYFVENLTVPSATKHPHFATDCPSRDIIGWIPISQRGWATGVPMNSLERVSWQGALSDVRDAPYFNQRDSMLYRPRRG
jgi:hypothetical protein